MRRSERIHRRCFLTMTSVIAIFGSLLLATALRPESADIATIVGSGSTNTAGFRIKVDRSGEAVYIPTPRGYGSKSHDKPRREHQRLSRALVDRLYADLEAAKPLSSLPVQRCMKSASFSSTLLIEFGEQRTPDLNCGDGGDTKLQALIRDANEIVKVFGPGEIGGPVPEQK